MSYDISCFFYCFYPLLISILYFCLKHFSYTIKAMDFKLHMMIYPIEKSAVHKNWYFAIKVFLVVVRNLFSYHIFVPKILLLQYHRRNHFNEKKCSAQELKLRFVSWCLITRTLQVKLEDLIEKMCNAQVLHIRHVASVYK